MHLGAMYYFEKDDPSVPEPQQGKPNSISLYASHLPKLEAQQESRIYAVSTFTWEH